MAKVYEKKSSICPVTLDKMLLAQKIIAGKWKFVILLFLSHGVKRFNELNRMLPGISQGILTQQLRELEYDGLVHREIYKEIPPKVEYSLTDLGRKFIPVLDQVLNWVQFYNEQQTKHGKK